MHSLYTPLLSEFVIHVPAVFQKYSQNLQKESQRSGLTCYYYYNSTIIITETSVVLYKMHVKDEWYDYDWRQ